MKFCPWDFFVVVVTRRVACPDDEVYGVFEVFVNPVEGCIDQGYGRIAVRGFCAELACRALTSMTGLVIFGGGVSLVEGIWVEVCGRVSESLAREANGKGLAVLPVMCKNLP